MIEVLVKDGDEIGVEDALITLETDKAAMDVPSTVAGRIESVLVKVGDHVSEGTEIAIVQASDGAKTEERAEPAAEKEPKKEPAAEDKPKAGTQEPARKP